MDAPGLGVPLGELRRGGDNTEVAGLPLTTSRSTPFGGSTARSRGGAATAREGAAWPPSADGIGATAHAAPVTALDAFDGGADDDDDGLVARRASQPPTRPSAASRHLLSADASGCVVIWRAARDAPPDTAAAWAPLQVLRPVFLRGLRIAAAVARPGDALQFAVAAPGHVLRLIDLITCTTVRDYEGADYDGCGGGGGDAGLTWSPDGRWLAMGADDGVLRVWHGDTAAPAERQPGGAGADKAHRPPGGESAAAGGGSSASQVAAGLVAFPAPLIAVAWCPRLNLVAVGAAGGSHAVMLCAP